MLRMLINKFSNKLSKYNIYIRTCVLKVMGGADYHRWGNNKNLSATWDSRTIQIASLIQPGDSVIEFGAGRLVLKHLLPKDCSYTPSDLVSRGAGTIICNLNGKTLPHFPQHNVAVFSGVLEYVNDVSRLITHLSNYVDDIIASYEVIDSIRTNSKQERRMEGWVNDFSRAEFIDIFSNAGFSCILSKKWKTQIIFKFTKNSHR